MNYLLLPAYNEAAGLSALLLQLRQERHCVKPLEIIVVDDGSTDSTASILDIFEKESAVPLQVLRHEKNKGLGHALSTGFHFLIPRLKITDAVFTMDADDTHPVALMPLALTELNSGADIVLFSRFVAGGRMIGVGPIRYLAAYGASWFYRILYPYAKLRDFNCGYRAYSGSLLLQAREIWGDRIVEEPGFAANAEILLKLLTLRPRIRELPFTLRYDLKQGKSKMNIGATIHAHLHLGFKRF